MAKIISLYTFRFQAGQITDNQLRMTLVLNGVKQMTNQRDYNHEIKDTDDHKYAYNLTLMLCTLYAQII